MNAEQNENDKPIDPQLFQHSPPEKAREALSEFWSQLTLNQDDRTELWLKRGLPPWECERAGYRTNHRPNRAILERLAQTYEEATLVESGLWMRGAGGEAKINSQFCGMGLVRRAREDEPSDEWGWKEDGKCNPIIIPYFDSQGRLFLLRPHKGGIAGKPPHLYVARSPGVADSKCAMAVITEGEFKAWALNAVLNSAGADRFAIAALPGISMARNQTCLEELREWLKAVAPERVVIAYDSEEKGDPRLPSFKPNPRKRHEAQIWARYLANLLNRQGYNAAVAVLPKAWRSPNTGKADWDSRLATRIAQSAQEPMSTDQDAHWLTVLPAIRQEFQEVLNSARKPHEFRGSGVFTEMEENFIEAGLTRLYRGRELRYGGGEELGIAQRLKNLAGGPLKDVSGVYELGEAYRKTFGGYFILQAPKDADKTRLSALRQQALKDGDTNLAWFCDMAGRGYPKSVSDFRITCHYTLVREDGTRQRIVSLENRRGEKSGLKSLDSRASTAPRDWREWLANAGNFTWREGEKELEKMLSDLYDEAAFLDVIEATYYGQHEPSGLWLYRDVAYGPGGEEILPDEHGVFWWTDHGYKVSAQGSDQQSFRQPLPQMRPGEGLVFDGGYRLVRGAADDPLAIQGLFQELSHCVGQTLGGSAEACLSIGAFLAFAAAREIFERHGCFPGLWITGEKGSGKTTLAQFLMECFGFQGMKSGIGLRRNSSAVGIQIAVEQFSNLPVWLDEWREMEVHPDKRAIIHSAYNRELPSKYSENGRMRTIRTAFIVVGESTTSDAATRSRYPHIHVSKSRRQADHLGWFEDHRKLFFVLGRYLMRNRPKFCALVLETLSKWLNASELAGIDPRAALVHGVPYAAFSAVAQLLQSHAAADLDQLRKGLMNQTNSATDEVQATTDISQFFEDFYAAFVNGAFGTTVGELKRYLRVERKEVLHPPGFPSQAQAPWGSVALFFKPTPVIDVLRRYKRAQGQDLRLSQMDLRRQMATKKDRLPPKHQVHRKPFAGKNNEGCWGIDLDFHPMGFQPMSDADWLAHLEKSGVPAGCIVSSLKDDWQDPREGDLFAIVHKLLDQS